MLTTKGIVLNSFNYNENDKIVFIFSEHKGLMFLYARGVNKLTSKNRYGLQNFSISNFEIFYSKKSKISRLKRVILEKSNLYIARNYNLYVIFSFFTDILEKNLIFKKKNIELFNLTYSFLINSNEKDWLEGITFLLFKALKITGSNLNLDYCYYCKKNTNIKTFCFKLASFICKNCFYKCKKRTNLSFLHLIHNWNHNICYNDAISICKKISKPNDIYLFFVFLINYYSYEIGIYSDSLYAIFKIEKFLKFKKNKEKDFKGYNYEK